MALGRAPWQEPNSPNRKPLFPAFLADLVPGASPRLFAGCPCRAEKQSLGGGLSPRAPSPPRPRAADWKQMPGGWWRGAGGAGRGGPGSPRLTSDLHRRHVQAADSLSAKPHPSCSGTATVAAHTPSQQFPCYGEKPPGLRLQEGEGPPGSWKAQGGGVSGTLTWLRARRAGPLSRGPSAAVLSADPPLNPHEQLFEAHLAERCMSEAQGGGALSHAGPRDWKSGSGRGGGLSLAACALDTRCCC